MADVGLMMSEGGGVAVSTSQRRTTSAVNRNSRCGVPRPLADYVIFRRSIGLNIAKDREFCRQLSRQ